MYNYISIIVILFYYMTRCAYSMLCMVGWGYGESFKSLSQNTIGRNAYQYTVNKQTYIHYTYIQRHINKSATCIYKRKREGHTNQNEMFFFFKFQRIS